MNKFFSLCLVSILYLCSNAYSLGLEELCKDQKNIPNMLKGSDTLFSRIPVELFPQICEEFYADKINPVKRLNSVIEKYKDVKLSLLPQLSDEQRKTLLGEYLQNSWNLSDKELFLLAVLADFPLLDSFFGFKDLNAKQAENLIFGRFGNYMQYDLDERVWLFRGSSVPDDRAITFVNREGDKFKYLHKRIQYVPGEGYNKQPTLLHLLLSLVTARDIDLKKYITKDGGMKAPLRFQSPTGPDPETRRKLEERADQAKMQERADLRNRIENAF